MTRIIAGVARGRRLRVPKGETRPTTDRVRESLFGALDHLLGGFVDLRVLDLFAGSGALGLEAASRGAARVVLVERDRAAAAVARANARVVDHPGIEVVAAAVEAFLCRDPEPYDLVLADPPYALTASQVEALLELLGRGWLADDAVVVVERATRDGQFAWPPSYESLRESTYGETTLWYGRSRPTERRT